MTNMTPEEIRVALAKAIGYTHIKIRNGRLVGVLNGEGEVSIPLFHVSLDACAEFERRLKPDQLMRYVNHLEHVTISEFQTQSYKADLVLATPLQRCEAYLRTINTETR